MILTFIFKIYERMLRSWQHLTRKIKILKWIVLYRNRAHIDPNFSFGRNCFFYFDATHSSVYISKAVNVRSNFEIRSGNRGKLIIGENVFFNNNCSLHCLSEITIGNNNQFGEGVKMYDHNHRYKEKNNLISEQGYSLGHIRIGNNCWIGSNVVILKGVHIGDNVIVGTNVVVYKDIASNMIIKNDNASIIRSVQSNCHLEDKKCEQHKS